jgi:hypothetical protein
MRRRPFRATAPQAVELSPAPHDPARCFLERARRPRLHERDLSEGYGRVQLPHALERKYPKAAAEWGWQFVFPAAERRRDPRSGVSRRHHLHERTIQRAFRQALRRALDRLLLEPAPLPAAYPARSLRTDSLLWDVGNPQSKPGSGPEPQSARGGLAGGAAATGRGRELERAAAAAHRPRYDALPRVPSGPPEAAPRASCRAPCGEGATMSAPPTEPPSPPASLLGPDRGLAALVRCLRYHGTNCAPETWRRLGFRKGRMRRGARTCNRRPSAAAWAVEVSCTGIDR